MRRPAMKFKVIGGAARGDDDVDVWSVRGEKQSSRGSASSTPERCARERQPKQAVRQIVQDPNITR